MRSRRILAKLIDFFAFGGFMSLGMRWFDSPWAGLALAGGYLLLSDALGMSAKNWFSLGVIDVNTGRRCSIASSILRNSPWVAGPLFRTALMSFHAGAEPTLAYDAARGVVGFVGLIVAATLWKGLGPDGSGRHWADELAGTKVLSLKPGEAVRPPPARDVARKGGMRTNADEADDDAVDFDDADESVPKRTKPNPPRKPGDRDRDAVDFDDAN